MTNRQTGLGRRFRRLPSRYDAKQCDRRVGRILDDVRTTPGPEVFAARPGLSGPLDVLVRFSGRPIPRGDVPVAVLRATDRPVGIRELKVSLMHTIGDLILIRSDQL